MKQLSRLVLLFALALSAAALASSLPATASSPQVAPVVDTPRKVAETFYAAYDALDFDRLRELYADDVHFEDPTLGMSMDGADTLIAQYRDSFAIVDHVEWLAERRFATGEFVVTWGHYSSQFDGALVGRPGVAASGLVPFASVLQVHAGRVVRHLDFLAYDIWDAENPMIPVPVARPREESRRLHTTAIRYYEAITASPPDIDAALELFADDFVFRDPTFELGTNGKDQFRSGWESVAQQSGAVEPNTRFLDSFASGSFLVLFGEYSQLKRPGAAASDRVSMNFLTVLQLRAGQFVRQWDFYDAASFRAAMSTE